MRTQISLDDALLQDIYNSQDYKRESGSYKIGKVARRLIKEALDSRRKSRTSVSLEYEISKLNRFELLKILEFVVDLLGEKEREENKIYIREVAENFIKSLVDKEKSENHDLVILAKEFKIDIEKLTKIRNKIWECE